MQGVSCAPWPGLQGVEFPPLENTVHGAETLHPLRANRGSEDLLGLSLGSAALKSIMREAKTSFLLPFWVNSSENFARSFSTRENVLMFAHEAV